MQTYADDYNELDRYGYQPRWDTWGRLTQSVFANIPLITTIGALVHWFATTSHTSCLGSGREPFCVTPHSMPCAGKASISAASFTVCQQANRMQTVHR